MPKHRYTEDPSIENWWNDLTNDEKKQVRKWLKKAKEDGDLDDWEWDEISYAYTEMPIGIITGRLGKIL